MRLLGQNNSSCEVWGPRAEGLLSVHLLGKKLVQECWGLRAEG